MGHSHSTLTASAAATSSLSPLAATSSVALQPAVTSIITTSLITVTATDTVQVQASAQTPLSQGITVTSVSVSKVQSAPQVITVTATPPAVSAQAQGGTTFGSPISSSISSTPSTSQAPLATALPAVQPSGNTQAAGTMESIPGITQQRTRGPFTPEEAILGGIPTIGLDVPVTVVFLILFLTGAATHFTIHELNGKRGHKFHISDMVFDFCMVRTVTCTMRIVWAFRPTNNSIVLAALIFENAGVVVLFAVNILFTQRILRALHPRFGWSKPVSIFFLAMLASVVLIIIVNIIAVTASFFTLDPSGLKIAKGFILFGAVYTMTLSLFPILVLFPASLVPGPIERFGVGPFRFKVQLLIFATLALAVGSITRLIADIQARPKDLPALIDGKAIFYTTGFLLEIIVVVLYAVCRIDLLFHVPDGCKGPGDYAAGRMPRSDEEGFFQDVDVKMRMSISDVSLPMEPEASWQEKNGGDMDELEVRPYQAQYGGSYQPRQPYQSSPYQSTPAILQPGPLKQAVSSTPSSSASSALGTSESSSEFIPVEARADVVAQAMRQLELQSGIEAQHMGTKDSDVMLYAFNVKKSFEAQEELQRQQKKLGGSQSTMNAPQSGYFAPDKENNPFADRNEAQI